ncbi:MAG TPA: hypothetical protein VJ276_14575 [Thermoanaerobaculia bacterium]|nr:hypothetical protein [Thermoanaerobaculia bacterium]
MKFAKVVFGIAAVYGLVVLLPQYFIRPPAEHPEFFYGFTGVAVAWQVLFMIMARDPVRFRPAMWPAILEKLGFGVAAVVLYAQGRLAVTMLAAGLIDLLFAALFVVALRLTAR